MIAGERCIEKARPGRPPNGAWLLDFQPSSTDSNLAMSPGIPAVTIGVGGVGGNWHSRNEWYKPVDAYYGPQNALLTVLILTGLDGVTKPALQVRAGR
jgi:tripeptide aminopeptidase